MNRLTCIAVIACTAATACGPSDTKKESAEPIIISNGGTTAPQGDETSSSPSGMTLNDFASEYAGVFFYEVHDAQQNLLDRDQFEYELEFQVDPSRRLLVEGLSWCPMVLDPSSKEVPPQSCVEQIEVGPDGTESSYDAPASTIEVSGSWTLNDDLLRIEIRERLRVQDEETGVTSTYVETSIFEGIAVGPKF